MDDQSIRNTLAILRKLNGINSEITAYAFLESIAGPNVNQRTILRVAAYLQDQFHQARIVIRNSTLVQEAQVGVLQAIDGLDNSFAINRLNLPLRGLVPAVTSYISSLVILLSASGISTNSDTPEAARDLAAEITAFQNAFEGVEIDPVVRDVAKKHMEVLATLLRHVSIFGVEAALTSYFELIMRLRRVDSQSTPESKAALDPLMSKVKTWGDRLGAIDEAMNKGANLLGRVKGAGNLLQYIPGVLG